MKAFQQPPMLNQPIQTGAPLTFGVGKKAVGLQVHIKQEADEGTAGSTGHGMSRDKKCFTLGKMFTIFSRHGTTFSFINALKID